jgi:hypothetical protein
METKGKFRERIRREGREAEYIARREALKKQGMSPKEAHVKAAEEFPPMANGSEKESTNGHGEQQGDNQTENQRKPMPLPILFSSSVASGIAPGPVRPTVEMFRDKKPISIIECIRWVAENLAIEDVTPEMAPSAGAWAMLETARFTMDSRNDFYKNLFSKLIPAKTQLDDAERFSDDGRKQFNILGRIEEARRNALLSSGAERPDSES